LQEGCPSDMSMSNLSARSLRNQKFKFKNQEAITNYKKTIRGLSTNYALSIHTACNPSQIRETVPF
jgi:hypothetical protein